jgi:CBS domain-containing protein
LPVPDDRAGLIRGEVSAPKEDGLPTKNGKKDAQKVRDVMTADPVCCTPDTTVMDAARKMRSEDIGDVLVADGDGKVCIMTDRDIVVRVIAEGRDPASTKLSDVCTTDVATVSPDTPIATALGLMRDNAVRRIPVVEDGRACGIVSIGDLAERQDPDSALADISAAPPNN